MNDRVSTFISHASAAFGEGKARKELLRQDPPSANDMLFDVDMVRTGLHWTRSLYARAESSPANETGKAWQRTDFFGNGDPAEASLGDDGSLQNPSGTSGLLPQSKSAIKNKSTGMNDGDFWDDLLGYIRDQVLVPVVGPDLTVVKVGDAEQTLATFIGHRLTEKFHLTPSPGMAISICLVEPPPLPSKKKEVRR